MRIAEFDTNFLKDATALVDARIEQLFKKAHVSPDPDALGVYDSLEYFIGFGFIACQTYSTCIISYLEVDRTAALDLPPKHRNGETMISLVNAAANYWKHSSEWLYDEPPRIAKTSLTLIESLGIETTLGYYPLGNVLHRILEPHPVRFGNLLPFLTQWRDFCIDYAE